MENLISRLETVVGKLEGFTAKFCDGGSKIAPRSFVSLNEPLPDLGNREAGDKNRQKLSDSAQPWRPPDVPDNAFPYWVSAYEGIISGPLAKFLKASQRIGDTVLTQAALVESVFRAQRQGMIELARKRNAGHLMQVNIDAMMQQIADKLADVQKFREQWRGSFYFNHLSTVSKSILSLNWMTTSDSTMFIQTMMDSGKFFSNRVLQEFRENSVHTEWVNAWYETLAKLKSYVNEFHLTSLTWDSNKQDDDALSRDNDRVVSSRYVTGHKQAVPSQYQEFSTGSDVTSARNHEVFVHPSQSAINIPTPRKTHPQSSSTNDNSGGSLTKRASNPETNPYNKQEYYNVVRHVNNNNARDFSQNNSAPNSKRIQSNVYEEISSPNRQQNSDYANEKEAQPSNSFGDKPKKTISQKDSALPQEFGLKPFNHARSESQFNSSSSFPSEFKSDMSESVNIEAPPYPLKATRNAINPYIMTPEAQFKARPPIGPPRAANVTPQSHPNMTNPNISSAQQGKHKDFFPSRPLDQKSGFQHDSNSQFTPTAQQGQTQTNSRRTEDQARRSTHTSNSKGNLAVDRNTRAEQKNTQRDRTPRHTLEGKKWILENYSAVKDVIIEVEDSNQSVYISGCDDCIIKVVGKTSTILIDSCNRTSVIFDEIISCLEIVNCQKIQGQALVKVPAITVEKTDGCSVFLNRESINARILTSKSSAVNILVPNEHGDYREYAIPEQFCTQWNGDQLITDEGRGRN